MLMNFQKIDTALIDVDSLPWVPFTPYDETVQIKLLKADPVRGETITLLKVPTGTVMAKHLHTGTVIVYTISGAWRYLEHDWVAKPGSVVFETASTSHTAAFMEGYGDETVTLNIVVGDLIFVDENGTVLAMENWRTMVERYLGYCEANGLTPQDVTSFAG